MDINSFFLLCREILCESGIKMYKILYFFRFFSQNVDFIRKILYIARKICNYTEKYTFQKGRNIVKKGEISTALADLSIKKMN